MIRLAIFICALLTIVPARAQTGGTFSPDSKAVFYADLQRGADMGAKINAALAKCPSTGCTVDARGLTGAQTLSTAVTLTNAQLLVGAVNVTQSATITLGQNGSLICQPTGFGQGNANGPSYFRMAAGANLQNMLQISGGMAAAQWCVLDGNDQAWEGRNNPTAGPLVAISSSHFLIDHVTAQNGAADGFMVYSGADQTAAHYAYGTNNGACCGTFRDAMSTNNGGDGYDCGGTADVIFEGSQAENNLGNAGIELNNCPSWRFVQYDIGGNQIGIWGHGAAWTSGVSMGSNNQIIGVGSLGEQFKQDIFFDGTNGGSFSNHIVGADIGPKNTSATTNAYAAVDLYNISAGNDQVTGVAVTSIAAVEDSSAVYIHGSSGVDLIGPVTTTGPFGGAVFNVPAATTLSGVCNAGACESAAQSLVGVTQLSAAPNAYASVAKTTGASSGDEYGASITNPSNASYASIEQDFFVGSAGSQTGLGSVYCQRNGGGSGGTCAHFVYNSSGTKVLAAVEGGATPTATGCATGSFLGQNTVGQFSLTAACSASTITLTFWTAAANGWTCPPLQDQTSGASFPQNASTTTSATFKGTGANGDVLAYGRCFPY